VIVAAVAMLVVVSGCRSGARRTQVAQAPAPAYPVYPTYPAPAPMETYAPPAPAAPSESELEMRRQAEMAQQALDAERRARELAEERSRMLEEQMSSLATPAPAMGGPAPFPSAGDDGAAMAFADDLRTRCDAEVIPSGNTVVVRLSDAFRPGSDQLKAEVRHVTAINAVAEGLMRHPGAAVAVVGHSDGTPIRKTKDKWTDNVHLSRARAEAVSRVLMDRGVSANRIDVDGRGDVEPLVYPERTSGDRARNRRVEIQVRF
jgi:flagellar motor protein MotB